MATRLLLHGKSCVPLSSSTTVIAFTGQERAAETITLSAAPAEGLCRPPTFLVAVELENPRRGFHTLSPLPTQRALFTAAMLLRLAI